MPCVWWTQRTSSATSAPGNSTALRVSARLWVPLPSKIVPERTNTFFLEAFFRLILLMVPLSETSTLSVSGRVMYWRSCEVSRRMGRMQASDASFGRSGLPNLNPRDSSEINCRMVDAEIALGVIGKVLLFEDGYFRPAFSYSLHPRKRLVIG